MIALWLCAAVILFSSPSQAISLVARDEESCEALDVCFMIDQTKSVGEENYQKMLDSLKKLIALYDVGPDTTHIAIETFAGEAQVRASLGDSNYHSKDALLRLVDDLKANSELGSPTRTDLGLQLVDSDVFTPEKGDRADVPDMLIVFTDGGKHESSMPYSAVLPALDAKAIVRVAVGIGRSIAFEELETIAGDGSVVTARDFDDLNNQLFNIKKASCDRPGKYTEWGTWSECSATCGGGTRTHSRTCTNPPPKNDGKTCEEQVNLGPAMESGECNTQDCPVTGNYTNWSEWEECSVTCGGGVQKRSRTCTSPPPSGGGPTCTEQNLGPAEEEQECNADECPVPGNYTNWTEWEECSVTCGGGVQKRSRTCTNPSPSAGGQTCTEQNLGPAEEEKECNADECPVPGNYTNWTEWEECSVTCGGGVQKRSRTCTNPSPSGGGQTCTEQNLGQAEEEQECNADECPVPGNYTNWTEWEECSVTCGGGVQKRSRTCTNPSPSGGGQTCTEQNLGPAEEEQECNADECPVPGNYTNWTEWGECSVTCGRGVQKRSRTCTNPSPSGGGQTCTEQNLGPAEEEQECNADECPVPGNYTNWTEWEECSVTCGGGVQKRSRTCTNPSPSGGGQTCTEQNLGLAEEEQECNADECPVPGNYTNWAEWGECSVTCGGGVQKRSRTCTNPSPSGGGQTCTEQNLGPAEEEQECNAEPCVNPCDNLDIALVLDRTRSLKKKFFRITLMAVKKLIAMYNVAPDKTRISIVTFSGKAKVHVSLGDADAQNEAALFKVIDKMIKRPHLTPPTMTDVALRAVDQKVFVESNGDRPGSPDVMVLFTDGGKNKASEDYAVAAAPLEDKGVKRIAVGIGRKIKAIDLEHLEEIAGSPEQVVHVAKFHQLEERLQGIKESTCG